MNKTLAVLGNTLSNTTSSNNLHHIHPTVPTRMHSSNSLTSNTAKSTTTTAISTVNNKENIPDKNSRSSRSREALSNITNASVAGVSQKNKADDKTGKPKTKREKSKSSKLITKRSAAVLTEAESVVSAVVSGGDAKKRKSDPMLIDAEAEVAALMALGNSSGVVATLTRAAPVQDWEDIDANDGDDPQAVSEYVNEIYDNLKEKELRDRINPNYLSTQHDINEKMRSILVDWLIEVHRMFKLLPETLFLAVNIIDRYLQSREVSRDKLQLVGITAMLIASKYEEIFAPECNDFVYISDGAYTKEQILSMEQTILNVLSFNLTHPSPLHFLRRYSKAAGSDITIHTLCKYLIEVMLIDVKLLKYTASQLAAGSVLIARAMTGRAPLWTPTLEHYSGYGEVVVRGVAAEMNDVLKKSKNSSLKALKKKYSTTKYCEVAEIPVVDL